MNAKVLFSFAEDEKLVECLSKFPCLFDLANPLYKNQSVKDDAWKEVAEYLNRSVQDCKKRWRNIKDTYLKRRKRGNEAFRSAAIKTKPWRLFEMLSFLDKVDHKRSSTTNIGEQEIHDEEESITIPKIEIIEESIIIPKTELIEEPITIPNTEMIEESINIPKTEMIEESINIPKTEMIEESINIPKTEMIEESINIPKTEMIEESINIPKTEMIEESPQSLEEVDDEPSFSEAPKRNISDNSSRSQPIKKQKFDDNLIRMMNERQKERIEFIDSSTRKNDDEIDVFFKSIAMTVKKFDRKIQNEAKLEILKVVINLETHNNKSQMSSESNS